MELLRYTVVGFAPGLFWLWRFRRKDDLEPEPRLLMLLVFLLGCASVQAIIQLRPLYQTILPDAGGWYHDILDSFVVTALPEEFVKLAALVLGAWLWSELDEPLDGILYGAAAGLGFASVENVYFLQLTERLEIAFQRGFTATLGHAAFTGSAGFFFGLAKVRSRGLRWSWMAAGLAIAVLWHGLYDLFLLRNDSLGLLSFLFVLPLCFVLLGLKVRWARSQSPVFHPDLAGPAATAPDKSSG